MHTLAVTVAAMGLAALGARAIEPPPPAQPVPAKLEIADGPFPVLWPGTYDVEVVDSCARDGWDRRLG